MNNQRNRYGRGGNRRIGAKHQNTNRTAWVLGIVAVIWIAYMIDLIWARDPWWLMLIYTVGVWSVGLIIAKPGKFSRRAYEDGFWRTIWNTITHNNSPRGRGRGRDRGRYYRR